VRGGGGEEDADTQRRKLRDACVRACVGGLVMACQGEARQGKSGTRCGRSAHPCSLLSARGCVSAGTLDTGPGVNEHHDAIVREKTSGWATAGDGAGLLECVGVWVGREVDGGRVWSWELGEDPLVYWIG
jgi:hypothetical protein